MEAMGTIYDKNLIDTDRPGGIDIIEETDYGGPDVMTVPDSTYQWINIQTCLAVIVIQSFYSIVNALRGCI